MPEKTERCAVCDDGRAVERTRKVEIQPLGRTAAYVRREWRCDTCRKSYTDDAQAAANRRAEVDAKVSVLDSVGGGDLRLLREISGVTQAELEAILGLGTNTVARWEAEQRPMPEYIATIVRLLALHPTGLRELAELRRAQRARAAAKRRRSPGVRKAATAPVARSIRPRSLHRATS